jgi:hypothetical protein
MDRKLRRRDLAPALAMIPALAAQTPAQTPASPDQELAQARERLAQNLAALSTFKLTTADEPAVIFRA